MVYKFRSKAGLHKHISKFTLACETESMNELFKRKEIQWNLNFNDVTRSCVRTMQAYFESTDVWILYSTDLN